MKFKRVTDGRAYSGLGESCRNISDPYFFTRVMIKLSLLVTVTGLSINIDVCDEGSAKERYP